MAADFGSIIDRVKATKSADKDQLLMEKSRGTITTTLIGAGLGLFIAYNRKYNLLLGAIMGATIVGVASNFFINRDSKKDK